jgi:2-iminobutanoate/2-iminopropanoate deaminase
MQKTILFSINAPKPVNSSYSQAVRVGELIFLSGTTGRIVDPSLPRGWRIDNNDPGAQTTQAMENIRKQLEDIGLTMQNVVKLVVYVTERSFFPKVSESIIPYFQKDPPAQTLVVVKGLALEEMLVEIDATAVS